MLAEEKAIAEIKEVKHKITESKMLIDRLKAEKVRQYEAYAEGLISREEYINKKKELIEKIEQLENEDKSVEENFGKNKKLLESAQSMLDVVEEFEEANQLTRTMVEKLLANVYVHDKNHLEIEFLFSE